MKLESITINILRRSLTHLRSSGMTKAEFDKKDFGPEIMKYAEEYCTKNGFDIINCETHSNMRVYHLIKR